LTEHLAAGDLVIDGGNSRHSDSRRRAASLGARGLGFVDSGTSGGVWGLQNGYCLMVGGTPADIARLAPIFTTLAPPEGWLHCGPAGAGHFVKMVHNGIEYAMMQGYAEGFEILRASPYALDLGRISGLWNRGSVVRSWLLELAERAFAKDKDLSGLMDFVQDSGEGRWTVEQAIETGVPAPTIALSLFARFSSQQTESFAGKVLAALRQEFGGHPVKSKSPSA
jgi:6-phosphogluconate dehydrogenase